MNEERKVVLDAPIPWVVVPDVKGPGYATGELVGGSSASFDAPSVPVAPVFEPIPASVSLSRIIRHPVERYEVWRGADLAEDWTWIEFEPVRLPDPFLPVPLLDYGEDFFEAMAVYGTHYIRYGRSGFSAWWAEAEKRIKHVAESLRGFPFIPELTATRVITGLWETAANPAKPPKAVATIKDRLYRERMEAMRAAEREQQARAEAVAKQTAARKAEAERRRLARDAEAKRLAYGGDGISIAY